MIVAGAVAQTVGVILAVVLLLGVILGLAVNRK